MRIKEELMIKKKKENSTENVYVSKKEHQMYRNMLARNTTIVQLKSKLIIFYFLNVY